MIPWAVFYWDMCICFDGLPVRLTIKRLGDYIMLWRVIHWIVLHCHLWIAEPCREISNNTAFLTANTQFSLCKRAIWSEPLQVTWTFCDSSPTHRTRNGVSKLTRRLHWLLWFYTVRNATLLKISRHGSVMVLNITAGQIGHKNVDYIMLIYVIHWTAWYCDLSFCFANIIWMTVFIIITICD